MDKKMLEGFMRRLHGGDLDALDGIYALTSRGVYLLAFSILRNSEGARDIMQETFIRVAANIDKYRLGTNALAWICKIARNLSYREFANGKKRISIDAIGSGICDTKADSEFWTAEIDLDNALARLSEQEREVVTLFSIRGYKHREIARILGRPLGTVLWIYHRAIKKLRKFLE